MVEKQLAGFFKWESDFRGSKGGWERGKDSQRPTATTLHSHRGLKFAGRMESDKNKCA